MSRPAQPHNPAGEAEQPFYHWRLNGVDLDEEEARAAYIGTKYPEFEPSFALFDEARGFMPTFLGPPLLVGFLWFFYRKMILVGLLFLILYLGLGWLTLPEPQIMGLVIVTLNAAGAFTGRWFYWLTVDRKISRALVKAENNPSRALGWLRANGGVNTRGIIVLSLLSAALLWATFIRAFLASSGLLDFFIN